MDIYDLDWKDGPYEEIARLEKENERLRELLKQFLRYVEQEGDDTLAAIIDTQVNTDASR